MRLLIALGGNAIKQAHEAGTAEEQWLNCLLSMKHIAVVVSRMGPVAPSTLTAPRQAC